MKCWKCGKENTDGSSICIHCSSSLIRPEPVTETGRAMRQLYDHYGPEEVLSNSAYLVNGLGDLLDDSKKLRSQLKMAADAGVFRLYKERLSVGFPDPDFDQHVHILLTEDAGLSDKVAGEIAGYFDEMIGWRIIKSEEKADAPIPPKPPAPPEPPKEPGPAEVPPPPPSKPSKTSDDRPVSSGGLGKILIPAVAGIVVLVAVFGMISGGKNKNQSTQSASSKKEYESTSPVNTKADTDANALSHSEYIEAEIGTTVTIEAYVQGKTKWINNAVSFFLQDQDGGYFVYEMGCSEEEYDQLIEGQLIRVSGTKSYWEGETEITDASFELLDGSYIAPAIDLTDLFNPDHAEIMSEFQNEKIRLELIEVSLDPRFASDPSQAIRYGFDNSGSREENSDLYFVAADPYYAWGYTFVVNSDMFDNESDLYTLAESLEVGDTITVKGFLYWYDYGDYIEGNPWITSIEVEERSKDQTLGLILEPSAIGREENPDLPEGLVVNYINQNSLAEIAGFQFGDIITAVNGFPVTNVMEMRTYVPEFGSGEKVVYTILRKNEAGEYEESDITVIV